MVGNVDARFPGTVLLLALLAACGRSADGAPEGVCVGVATEAVIDGGDGGFHHLADVAFGPEGRLFVLDGGEKRLIAYDGSGMELWRRGREGAGPGEMRQPDGLSVVDGMVAVRDHGSHRLTFWSGEGQLLEVISLSEYGFTGYPGWLAALSPERVLATTMPPLRPGSSTALPGAVVIGARGARRLDTIAGFSFPAPQMVGIGGTAMPVMPDFAPYPHVATSMHGTVYVSRDGGYPIERFDAQGRPMGTLRGPPEGPPFTVADRERSLERLPGGVRIDDVRFPSSYPAVAGLTLGVEGDLLVRTHFRDGEAVRWDRWSPDGEYRHSLMIPARFTYVAFSGDRLAVVDTDSLDIPTVAIQRLAGAVRCAGTLPVR